VVGNEKGTLKVRVYKRGEREDRIVRLEGRIRHLIAGKKGDSNVRVLNMHGPIGATTSSSLRRGGSGYLGAEREADDRAD